MAAPQAQRRSRWPLIAPPSVRAGRRRCHRSSRRVRIPGASRTSRPPRSGRAPGFHRLRRSSSHGSVEADFAAVDDDVFDSVFAQQRQLPGGQVGFFRDVFDVREGPGEDPLAAGSRSRFASAVWAAKTPPGTSRCAHSAIASGGELIVPPCACTRSGFASCEVPGPARDGATEQDQGQGPRPSPGATSGCNLPYARLESRDRDDEREADEEELARPVAGLPGGRREAQGEGDEEPDPGDREDDREGLRRCRR